MKKCPGLGQQNWEETSKWGPSRKQIIVAQQVLEKIFLEKSGKKMFIQHIKCSQA